MANQPETTVETRSAPAWAWEVIDETLNADAKAKNFGNALRDKIAEAHAALTVVPPTAKSQAEYLDDPSNCPCCNSSNILGESLDHYGGGVSQDISCNDCGARWGDIYQLARYDLTSGPNAEAD